MTENLIEGQFLLPSKYDAIIFDLFGTLVDYLPQAVYQQAFQQLADIISVSVIDLRRVWAETLQLRDTGVTGGITQDIAYVGSLLGVALTENQLLAAAEIRLSLYRRNLQPRNGALSTIQALQSSNYRVGLISDCAAEIPRLWLDSAFASLIAHPIFSVDVGMTKPDPRIYQICCSWLKVEPSCCLYIGDGSSTELTGARQVGMDAILICTPYERAMVMQREEAQKWDGPVIERIEEVLDHVDRCKERA